MAGQACCIQAHHNKDDERMLLLREDLAIALSWLHVTESVYSSCVPCKHMYISVYMHACVCHRAFGALQ